MTTALENRRYAPNDRRPVMSERRVGEIAPGCLLIESDGNYAIMYEEAPILEFPRKPTPDPDPESVHEDGPLLDASIEWVDKVMDWAENTTTSPETGYVLCNAAIKAGWVQGGNYAYVLMWFYDRAGRSLEGLDGI